jgi:3-hydroxyisobutyrate dehydrogenase-like beta-hydroxyacid dehydrogenase
MGELTDGTVGFIGLGAMGRPMARAILDLGRPLVVHDAMPSAVEHLVEHGARPAASGREVAEAAELVFTMLPRAEDVVEAVLGPDGVAAGIRAGGVLVDTSTIDVGTARSLAGPLAERGAAVLDGGVSGSPQMAWERKLTLMIGGDEATFDRHRPVFEALSSTLIYTGPLGSAKVVKLANNMVAAITTAALAEAYALITRSGADPLVARQAMGGSWANSTMLAVRPPLPGMTAGAPADNDYAAEFSIDYIAKDLGAALETARQTGTVMLTAGLVRQLFTAAAARGEGHLDLTALIRTIRAFGAPEA